MGFCEQFAIGDWFARRGIFEAEESVEQTVRILLVFGRLEPPLDEASPLQALAQKPESGRRPDEVDVESSQSRRLGVCSASSVELQDRVDDESIFGGSQDVEVLAEDEIASYVEGKVIT